MPKLEEHCAESMRLFKKPFTEVHIWLDEYAGSPECGMRHRRKRHHLSGIEEAGRRFGKKAVEAAYRHIVSDLKMEGWTEGDPFPKGEGHYIKLGLF